MIGGIKKIVYALDERANPKKRPEKAGNSEMLNGSKDRFGKGNARCRGIMWNPLQSKEVIYMFKKIGNRIFKADLDGEIIT